MATANTHDKMRRRTARPVAPRALLWLAVGAGGCASSAEAQKTVEMSRTIERLRTENATYAKHVEELENRVFILSDQLESQRVASKRVAAPELPQVKLRPEPAPVARAEPVLASDDGAAGTQVGDDEIEYAGDAARLNGRRPVLRLYGGGGDVLPPIEIAPAAPPPVAIEREGHRARPERRASAPTPAPAPAVKLSALQLYNQSLDHLRSSRHDDAVTGFRSFIQRFPEHDYADNAQYWLGECFYDRKDWSNAAREFRRVVERFPQGNKVPDALLKAGFSHVAGGDPVAACRTLGELMRSFPQHDAAGLAAAKVAELPCGGPAPGVRPASQEVP